MTDWVWNSEKFDELRKKTKGTIYEEIVDRKIRISLLEKVWNTALEWAKRVPERYLKNWEFDLENKTISAYPYEIYINYQFDCPTIDFLILNNKPDSPFITKREQFLDFDEKRIFENMKFFFNCVYKPELDAQLGVGDALRLVKGTPIEDIVSKELPFYMDLQVEKKNQTYKVLQELLTSVQFFFPYARIESNKLMLKENYFLEVRESQIYVRRGITPEDEMGMECCMEHDPPFYRYKLRDYNEQNFERVAKELVIFLTEPLLDEIFSLKV